MKNIITIVLVVVFLASLGFGFMQKSEADRVTGILEVAVQQAEHALAEAKRQELIATSSRAAAERAAMEARVAEARAQQALADCNKRRR